MTVSAHIASVAIRGILLGILCGTILAVLGCAPLIAPGHAVPKNPYAYQFEEYWYKFDRLYPYFDYKHVNWLAAYDHYRPLLDKVENETQLVALLAQMTKPLKDVHVWFKSPDGKYVNTYEPARATDLNWSADALNKYVPDLAYYGGADWGFGHIQGFAYVFIADWNRRALSINEFEAVLHQFQSNPGLILDVRMNAGGDEPLAYKIARYFADQRHLSEYYRYRNGPLPGELGRARPKYLEPSPGLRYAGPVMLLIGPDSFSSTENFIAAMQTLPNVTTIGETTGGASGCPLTYPLGNGWKYSVPVCFDMTADHRVIEWNGIRPEVIVKTTPADFRNDNDPVLNEALKLLKAKLKGEEKSRPTVPSLNASPDHSGLALLR